MFLRICALRKNINEITPTQSYGIMYKSEKSLHSNKLRYLFSVTNYALCKSMFTNKEPHSYNFILNSYAHCAIGINGKLNE